VRRRWRARARVCVGMGGCVWAGWIAWGEAAVCAYGVCVRVRACACVCVHAPVLPCLCASSRACMYVCARACTVPPATVSLCRRRSPSPSLSSPQPSLERRFLPAPGTRARARARAHRAPIPCVGALSFLLDTSSPSLPENGVDTGRLAGLRTRRERSGTRAARRPARVGPHTGGRIASASGPAVRAHVLSAASK
jgi:hypothetical protein